MHILIAPNAFKNSLHAGDAADAIAGGLSASALGGTVSLCPVADGGDGTADLLVRRCGGERIPVDAHDPLGRALRSHIALIDAGRTAVVELADVSGLRLMQAHELDPLRANSVGCGELIAAALTHGVDEVILCVGGSATVDGGMGLLQALGVAFLDAAGRTLPSLPDALPELSRIDMAGVDPRILACRLTVLCDVDNPLLGERGAARVFGPQKGATPAMASRLDAALARLAQKVFEATGKDIGGLARGGAAGGAAAGLFGLTHAALVSGADHFLDRIEFERALVNTDLVITGEGSLDEQTACGKAPWCVATRAKARGCRVVGLAGQVPAAPSPLLRSRFDAVLPIGHRPMSLAEATASTAENLRRTAYELGNLLASRT